MTVGDRIGPALIRVRNASGVVVGAGFLVGPTSAVTCAHVIADDARAAVPPSDALTVDFPLLGGDPVPASVVSWQPIGADGTGDVAVLSLQPPPGAKHVPLSSAENVWGHRIRVCGFPAGFEDGRWLSGVLRAKQGTGWLQAEVEGVRSGFSGAPVWDEDRAGVVGMLVARAGDGTAFVVPSAALGEWDDLPEPFRGLAAFEEEDEPFFHGREADVARLLDHVADRSLVLVVGPSGSGKSSLVRAGLLPVLRRDGVHISVARLGSSLPELPRDRRALLFVDQFEEVVDEDPDLARAVLDRLAGARSRVVLTMRSDSLDRLLTASTARALDHAVMFVGPLDADGMRAAITEPVAVVGGVDFEDGLVERIIADAGREPGRLPLVEFALTELWRRRTGGWLTHQAYDGIGGVSGALTDYADRTLWLPETRAKDVLTRLAGPDGAGGFVRKRLDVSEVDDPEVLETLVATRLVVVNDGVVELAHQALVDRWERLRSWLAADREFVAWRAELGQRRAQWEDAGRDRKSLLGGVALARALVWRSKRELSAGEQDFIARSEARQRREVWTWRGVTALVTVVALVAAGLWVRTEAQLRESNASQLAQQSLRLRDSRPESALQLALAAWREEPGNPDARRALVAQQQDRGSADRLLPLGSGSYATSRDGGVIAVRSEDTQRMEVWDHERRWEFPVGAVRAHAVSPDGTALAVAAGAALTLWHIPDRTERWSARIAGDITARFDAEGRTLTATVEAESAHDHVLAWDVATAAMVLDKHLPVDDAVLTSDRRTVVAYEERLGPAGVVALDVSTGRRRDYGTPTRLLGHGEAVAECTPGGYRVHVVATGEERSYSRPLKTCVDHGFPPFTDISGHFIPLTSEDGDTDTHTYLHWATGSTYTVRSRVGEVLVAFCAVAPDGGSWAEATSGELRLVSGNGIRRTAADPDASWVRFTPDSRWLVVASPGQLRVHSVPDMRLERTIELPDGKLSLAVLSDREVAVLHAGDLTVRSLDGATPTRAVRVVAGEVVEVHPRPGHPGQVAVKNPGGLKVWDVQGRRVIANLVVTPAESTGGIAFDATGTRVAVPAAAGVEVWDVERHSRLWEFSDGVVEPIGFHGDTLLVRVPAGIQLWHADRLVGEIDHFGVLSGYYHVSDTGLHYLAASDWGDGRLIRELRSFPLDPAEVVTRLCGLLDREFTNGEMADLPVGVSRDRPCAR
ncbi:serine protease [Saccharothrix deserti]|uniref:serine protease n=1 Tax=Saccharothrix deserti TaxID=2593674 RepID=UPI00131C9290|nr:serine protease [Saccharothrix deserti]